MATKDSLSGENILFEFPGSDRNVYAEYLHITFIRRMRVGWFFGGLFFVVGAVTCVYILVYGVDTDYSPGYHPSPRAKFTTMMMPFVAPFGAVVFPVCAFFALFPLSVAGCRAFNFAWPRFYSNQCRRAHNPRYYIYGQSYFDSFERHPMRAVVGDKSVRVSEPDGKSWTLAFRNVRRAYRGKGLVVLESGAKLPSSRTVILDVSGMDRSERGRFYRFLDKRLPVDSHFTPYYMRWTGPAVGEAVFCEEAPRSGGATEKER